LPARKFPADFYEALIQQPARQKSAPAQTQRKLVDRFRVVLAQLYEKFRVVLKSQTTNCFEIGVLDESLWPVMMELLLSKEWTREDTRKKVKRASEFEIPPNWQMVFLPLSQVVYRSLDTDEFSPKTVSKLIEAVEAIESRIATYKTNVNQFVWEFRIWLTAHTGAIRQRWRIKPTPESANN
jgi:hypothetical protein